MPGLDKNTTSKWDVTAQGLLFTGNYECHQTKYLITTDNYSAISRILDNQLVTINGKYEN